MKMGNMAAPWRHDFSTALRAAIVETAENGDFPL
jgi:hypothetical protein